MAQKSWVNVPKESHFSLANIPFGIISSKFSSAHRPAIAIGEHALDLAAFAAQKGFSKLSSAEGHLDVFSQPTLNAFAALGRPFHKSVREYLQDVLSEESTRPEVLKENVELQKLVLIPQKEFKMHLPMTIGDYTDFYAGLNHAYAVCLLIPY